MQSLSSRKLTWREYFVVASLLFGLFFGAGNLIFPLHLGQLAGGHWGPAALGFLVTGVLLPLLSVMAIAVTRSEGVFDVGRPLGVGFALTFMVLIHATIGWDPTDSDCFLHRWGRPICARPLPTISPVSLLRCLLWVSLRFFLPRK